MPTPSLDGRPSSRAKGDILVVGSVALDSVETPFGESREALGGSAVFFSLAARYFGRVRLVGVVGSDFPEPYKNMLGERGVDLEGLEVADGLTFRWRGRFGRDLKDAKTLSTCLNVFQAFRPKLSEAQKACPVAFLGNIDPELQAEVLSQLKGPRIVACDTHQYWIKNKRPALKELLSKVDVFFINDEEARRLSRQASLLKAARMLASWGPRIVVIKKGEHGANLWIDGRPYPVPAFPVEDVTDPTGAGDSFAGGFLGYLASRSQWRVVDELKTAALYGSVIASFNVEDFGTNRLENLPFESVRERIREFVAALRFADASAAAPAGVLAE